MSDFETLPDIPVAKPVKKEEPVIELIFCEKCGCNYINSCKTHIQKVIPCKKRI